MNNVEGILKNAWDNIILYETGSLRLGIEHPLEWYVAYETPTNKALVILSSYEINAIESSKSIQTACRKREDGKYYISFQLLEKSQEDVFISMCSNLIEYSSGGLSEKDALKKVEFRYKQWRKLMEHQSIAVLSDEKRRGLIGELLYLGDTIQKGKEPTEALNGWVGPDGADQDFVYDEIWREVKTTGLSSDQVAIHSLEQLGNKENGILIISRVDPCAPETKDAFTLRRLIALTQKCFEADVDLLEKFTNKLNAVGYIDMDVYDRFSYKFYKSDIYDVNETFPRITRDEVRTEIIKCDYVVSISSLEDWKRG